MYDNVHLTFKSPDGGPPPDVSRYLYNAGNNTDIKTGELRSITGYLKEARWYGPRPDVTIYPDGIIIRESLPKLMYGSSLHEIDLRDAAAAVEMMSDLLHVNMGEASVTSLEFGANMAMRKPPAAYIAKLGELPRFETVLATENSRYYKPQGCKLEGKPPRQLEFYDKAAKAAKAGESIDEIERIFRTRNVLRYELRYRHRLAERLGWPERVRASTLSDRKFYRTVTDKWMEYYRKIKKDDGRGAYVPPATVRDVMLEDYGRFLAKAGPDHRAALIEELKNAGTFKDRSDYYRLKKKLDSIAAKGAAASGPDEDIKELDEAVRERYERCCGQGGSG